MGVIYFDDTMSNNHADSNVFINTGSSMIIHGGVSNTMKNSLVINSASCGASVVPDGNAARFWNSSTATSFTANTFLWRLYDYPYKTEPWQKYKHIFDHIDSHLNMAVVPPYDCEFTGNTFVNLAKTDKATEGVEAVGKDVAPYVIIKDNTVISKEEAKDFVIPERFQTIMDKAGLYIDEDRKEFNRLGNFNLISPYNRAENVEGSEVVFEWSKAENANKYLFTLATDPEFKQIISNKYVDTNSVTISRLNYNKTRYFWKVTAIANNTNSMISKEPVKSNQEYFSFTTKAKEVLDKVKMNDMIELCKNRAKTVVEGENPGDYKIGVRKEMDTLISLYEARTNSVGVTQKDLNKMVRELLTQFDILAAKKNPEYVDMYKLVSGGNWAITPNQYTISPERLVHTSKSTSIFGTAEKIPSHQIMKFKANIDNIGNGFVGYGIRAQASPTTVAWAGNNQYIVIIKSKTIEFQKFGEGESVFIEYPNDCIFSGQTHEIEYSALNRDDGSVDITFKVDGRTIVEYNDSDEPIMPEGYFEVYATEYDCTIELTADEAKYMYRAEFDGYDDDTVWYLSLNANKYSVSNTSPYVSDGIYTAECAGEHMYRAFMPIFSQTENETFITKAPLASQKLDCTGKKNVVIETKFKLGEGTVDNQFMYVGNNIALLKVDTNRVLRYNAVANNDGTAFKVYDDDFVIEPDRWNSLVMTFDFVSQRYQVTVDDGNGNIANSGILQFIYNHPKYEITDFRFARMLNKTDAPLSIDYFRIIDADYGKVEVTYNDGIELDGSAIIKEGDVFSFTSLNTPANLSTIKLADENGNDVNIDVEADGKDVTIIPEGLAFNTKYTLTIPASVIGTETEQVVRFRTKYDENATFAYPAGYSAQDELNVVYFGGSITNMEGWRVHSENWIKDKFPNATCYNASIGGTGAEYGWMRLNRDVISKNPDVVFVEFAVNDSGNSTTATYMESIVRNLNALEKPPVIIFVYTTVLNFDANMKEHERIAKAYGIQSISIHDYVESLYNTDSQFAKDWDNNVYLPDTTHPSVACSKIYGDYVNAVMTSDCSKYFVKPANNSLVTPLTEYQNYVYDYDNINLTLTETGDTYRYDFEGDELLLDYVRSNSGVRWYKIA